MLLFLHLCNVNKLEEEIEDYTTTLETVDDPAERERILEAINHRQDKIIKLSNAADSESTVRKSSRTWQPTAKMSELQAAEKAKRERRLKKDFDHKYESWKECCKNARKGLKGFCTEYSLSRLSSSLHIARNELIQVYEACRELGLPEQDVRRRVDT